MLGLNSPEEELEDTIRALCDRIDDYMPELMTVLRALLRRLD